MSDQLRVVGVIAGPDESVDAYKLREQISQLNLSYPQVRDRDLELSHLFRVSSTPTVVVIGPDGSIRYHGHGLPESWGDVL